MITYSKKADEKFMSIWFFFILGLIGAGLVIAVLLFSSSELDIKKIESDILISRLVNCVVENGYLSSNFINDKLEIFESCGIDKKVIDAKEGLFSLYYQIAKFDSCTNDGSIKCSYFLTKSFGVENFKNLCSLEGKNYPQCSEKYIYLIGEDGERYTLYVIAGSNQKIVNEVLI